MVVNDKPNEQEFLPTQIFVVNTSSAEIKSCKYVITDDSFALPINRGQLTENNYNGKNGYFTDDLFDGSTKSFCSAL